MSRRSYGAVAIIWVLAAVLAIVARPGPSRSTASSQVEALPTLGPRSGGSASFESDDMLPSALTGVRVEEVRGRWTGPGGAPFYVAVRSGGGADYLHRQIGREDFYLALRMPAPEPSRAVCTSCHQGQTVVGDRRGADARAVHQNIQPVHPAATGAQCRTCHTVTDVGRLRLENGETASIDHAYRLCAQCHFREVDSWGNGAHGKRLVGWRGRRVVMGCADCHDPHQPAAKARLPMAGVTLPGPLRPPNGESHD